MAQQARSDRVQITQDDVLRGLRREATLTGEGSTHAARVSAWGLIGKHLGMFVERRQQLGEDGQPVMAAFRRFYHVIKFPRQSAVEVVVAAGRRWKTGAVMHRVPAPATG